LSILSKNKEQQERYWQDRAERLILAAEKTADEMNNDLKKLYEEAQKAIQREIEIFYGRYSRDVGVSLEEARRALNKTELKAYLEQTKEYYAVIEATGYAFDPAYRQRLHRQLSLKSAMSRLEALQSDVQFQIEKLYAREQDAFRDGLNGTYEESYYRATFNLQQGLGFGSPFTALNTRVIEKAVQEKWRGENYSDRIWENKDRLTLTLQDVIPQGIAAGQNPRIIGKTIHDRMFGQGIAKGHGGMLGRSINLARTEFNHIANSATWDIYVESGVVEWYQFLATLDHATTDSCQNLDLKIFKLSEKMEGINYPPISSPPHPCRSTTTAHFPPDEIDAMFDDVATRIARDPITGKNYYVPADMSYKEWRESLTEEQGKHFLSNQKREKYYESDKEQLSSYKEFIREAKKEHGEELVSGLFADFPTTIGDFQAMKYLDSATWEIVKDNRQQLTGDWWREILEKKRNA